jgi:hypothetical protein
VPLFWSKKFSTGKIFDQENFRHGVFNENKFSSKKIGA